MYIYICVYIYIYAIYIYIQYIYAIMKTMCPPGYHHNPLIIYIYIYIVKEVQSFKPLTIYGKSFILNV